MLGLKVDMTVDTGAYPGMGAMISGLIESMLPGPVQDGGARLHVQRDRRRNKAQYVAYRGPWAAETFTRERLLDIVAHELGIEPLELAAAQRRHPRRAAARMITGRSLVGVTTRESLERMAEIIDLPAFRARQAAAPCRRPPPRPRRGHLHRGRARARHEGGGGGMMGPEQMRMRLEPDGMVLGVHRRRCRTARATRRRSPRSRPTSSACRSSRSESSPATPTARRSGFGTGGSRAATMAGGATLHTARALREQILETSADLLEASAGDLEITEGKVAVRGVPVSAITLARCRGAARPTPLEATRAFDGGEGGWSSGTHCAIVEVDVETGQVTIERYIVVEDCGALINPAIVEGQVRGGVAQGIGAVLLERSAYDDDAQFLAGTFMDYLLPTATEIPRIEIHHLETVPLDPDVNFRGVGEGGMIVSPPTLCNAIEDALAPFGVTITEQHLPPRASSS